VIYDTNFLIAVQGRKKEFSRAEALAWMKREDDGVGYITRIVEIEFLGGFSSDAEATRHLQPFTILPLDKTVLAEAVLVMRELRSTGKGIGAADSIIAATSRLYGLPLVTENVKHFARVNGLRVVNYMA
jgi:predicted nucleic acid-binding protein